MQRLDKDNEVLEGMASETFNDLVSRVGPGMEKEETARVTIGKLPKEGDSFEKERYTININKVYPNNKVFKAQVDCSEKNTPISTNEKITLNGLQFKVTKVYYYSDNIEFKFIERGSQS